VTADAHRMLAQIHGLGSQYVPRGFPDRPSSITAPVSSARPWCPYSTRLSRLPMVISTSRGSF
jgi:hypothetical protein